SREKIMAPSVFNASLFSEMSKLICESLLELRDRKLITQNFIRKIIIPAFADKTIPGLKEDITNFFLANPLLPDTKGNYKKTRELSIAVPFGMAEFFEEELFKETFVGIKTFVAFNNERESNFTEYYTWLKDNLKIHVLTFELWSKRLLTATKLKNKVVYEKDMLMKFYTFLTNNRESIYETNLSYTRRGPYEVDIKRDIRNAWKLLRMAPIVLNSNNKLMPAFIDGELAIYLSSHSEYKRVVGDSIVENSVAKEFQILLTEGLKIEEFNNYQYVKEKVIEKYINIGDAICFENADNYEEEHIEDLKQIFKLIAELNDTSKVKELLNQAYIIAVLKNDDQQEFCRPGASFINTSKEGINLKTYFSELEDEVGVWPIDMEFYEQRGISTKMLSQLGVMSSPVEEGDRENINRKYGNTYWRALGNYCPNIKIIGLVENLVFIRKNPNLEEAKNKSVEILKLLLSIGDKLNGKITRSKTRPVVSDEISTSYEHVRQLKWLYDKNGELSQINKLSKFDLDQSIYGKPISEKEAYNRLGFIETGDDAKADAFDVVSALDFNSKHELLKQLAKELGKTVVDSSYDRHIKGNVEDTFDMNDWSSNEFPIKSLRNKERLMAHIKQQFFCADPITYEPVLRQIRVSKDYKIAKAYATGMYTNDSDVKICQMCKEPIGQAEVVEIANFGIELEQLNLCLCRNCAGKYKSLRDKKKVEFKKNIKSAIQQLNVDDDDQEYVIKFSSDLELDFTQIHVAEIQVIFSLLDEYGLPNLNNEILDMSENSLIEDLYKPTYL
ncbi:MAG: hypothetical protein LHW64_11805, partial [Candidatus Cloacimonetes bacterium]|nr:hypothetical protein [Candidatus Cloacimonadota bacterium]MDY0230764.1 hypothetical protein [Candidatus Cloacimonadaceae bacterium]